MVKYIGEIFKVKGLKIGERYVTFPGFNYRQIFMIGNFL